MNGKWHKNNVVFNNFSKFNLFFFHSFFTSGSTLHSQCVKRHFSISQHCTFENRNDNNVITSCVGEGHTRREEKSGEEFTISEFRCLPFRRHTHKVLDIIAQYTSFMTIYEMKNCVPM